MASTDQKFPPQKQAAQPGKEHLMDPAPQPATHEYNPSNKLLGKVALVTGGDSGIGRAVCHCFALEGATVAFTYVRVNGVAPGPIWTPLIPSCFTEEETARFGKEVPMKRAGQPVEVAPSYVFLASNVDSSYFTGQVLHPNGGTIVNA